MEKLKRGSKATSFNVKLADVEAFVDECKDFGALMYVFMRAIPSLALAGHLHSISALDCIIRQLTFLFWVVSFQKRVCTPPKERTGSRRVSRSTS